VRAYFHLSNNKSINKRKLHEAENLLHKSFEIIKEDLSEHRSISETKKDISDAEKIIDKKIEDIE
jgi:hypothetical protein